VSDDVGIGVVAKEEATGRLKLSKFYYESQAS
jgi:hypothetical protein